TGADRVFLVEDDIMVTPDIFRWHEAILEQPNVFVSCATAVNKSAHFPINGQYAMDESFQDSSAYYLSESAYSSHASAFQRESLGFVVAELANQQTYGRLKPGEEQDLLIQKFKKKSAWPYVPRAFNFGWHSYHISGQKLTGSLEERVVFLRKIVRDQEMLRQVSYNNQAVTAVPSRLHEWNGSVYNVQRYK
ncbi:MAG: hypothetical protein ACREQ5_31380, partial [Candidatus Dormibacteria bacterium]